MAKKAVALSLIILLLSACSPVTRSSEEETNQVQNAIMEGFDELERVQEEHRENLGLMDPDAKVDATIEVELGESASSKNLKVSFLDFWTQNQIDDTFDDVAAAGYTFCLIAFRIENISNSDITFYGNGSLKFYADGVEYTSTVSMSAQIMPRINGYGPIIDTLSDDNVAGSSRRTISSGRAIEGYAVCDIPSNTEIFEMEYDEFIFQHKIATTDKKIISTSWFDYSINSIEAMSEFEGYTAKTGNQLIVIDINLVNTFDDSVPMFDSDFQLGWGTYSDDEIAFPLAPYSSNQLPEEYNLAINETREGILVYDVPDSISDFVLGFLEVYEDGKEGNLFVSEFSI